MEAAGTEWDDVRRDDESVAVRVIAHKSGATKPVGIAMLACVNLWTTLTSCVPTVGVKVGRDGDVAVGMTMVPVNSDTKPVELTLVLAVST